MVDAWGKLEDGILAGNNIALGFFDECLRTKTPSVSSEDPIPARYCKINKVSKYTFTNSIQRNC